MSEGRGRWRGGKPNICPLTFLERNQNLQEVVQQIFIIKTKGIKNKLKNSLKWMFLTPPCKYRGGDHDQNLQLPTIQQPSNYLKPWSWVLPGRRPVARLLKECLSWVRSNPTSPRSTSPRVHVSSLWLSHQNPSSPPRVLHSLLVQIAGLTVCYEILHSRLHKTKYKAQQLNTLAITEGVNFRKDTQYLHSLGVEKRKQLRKWKQAAYRSNHEVRHHSATRQEPIRHAGLIGQQLNCPGHTIAQHSAKLFLFLMSQHDKVMKTHAKILYQQKRTNPTVTLIFVFWRRKT